MQKAALHITRKVAFISVGIIMIFNAVFMSVFSNINIGIISAFILGSLFMFYGIFLDNIVSKIPKWVKYIFFIGVSVMFIFISFLLVYGATDDVTYNEDAVIVLGSGIRGEKLTKGLENRLDCAIKYYHKNPDAVIVLSGGQGPQEDITESLAMERYMLSQGIPQEKIIREEKATSTYQNFTYSKQLLDEYFDHSYNVAYITSDYHIYRAGAIAEIAGFENASHCHSTTRWYSMLPSCMRECIGVLKFWLFNK
jgi:uncharacterized SAM-binding protein YcdF (DUF218 family)